MVSTVYLVVTVTVNRRQVAIPIVAVLTIEVMDFDQRLRREHESNGVIFAERVLANLKPEEIEACLTLFQLLFFHDLPGMCVRAANVADVDLAELQLGAKI